MYVCMYIYIYNTDRQTWNWTVVRTRTVVMVMYERRNTRNAFTVTFSDTTCVIQESMSLKYEPASEPLHISVEEDQEQRVHRHVQRYHL